MSNERILALLSERPMTVMHLRKALGCVPEQYDELARQLTTLARERKIRMMKNGWALAEGDNAYPERPPQKRNHASNVGRPLGEKSRAVMDALADGPKTVTELIALTGQTDTIYNRMNDLCSQGRIERIAHGQYALAGYIKPPEPPSEMHALVEKVIAAKPTKPVDRGTPHKCPLCLGDGQSRTNLTTALTAAICRACEGAGIVWSKA